MIIAIDFDGTLAKEDWPKIGDPVPLAIETVKDLFEAGHILLLWTCREGQKLQDARMWCNEYGIGGYFTAFNQNDPERTSKFNNDSRKLGADMYIDDKAFGWTGWGSVRDFFGFN